VQENRLAPFFAYLLIGVPLFAPKLIAVLPTGAIDGILVFVGVAGLFECQLWTRIKLLFREPSQFGSAPFARGVRPWRMHLYEEETERREMGRREMGRREMGSKGDERIHGPVYWPDHTLRLFHVHVELYSTRGTRVLYRALYTSSLSLPPYCTRTHISNLPPHKSHRRLTSVIGTPSSKFSASRSAGR
jgi:hypothetical protein